MHLCITSNCSRSFCADVVAPQNAVIADMEASVCDDWVGPGFLHLSAGMGRLVGRGKAAFGPITLRGCFDQCDISVFAVQIETAFGVTHGGGPERAIFPDYFSGRKFKTLHGTAGGPVEMVADFDDAADGRWMLCGKVGFFSDEFPVFGGEVDGATTGAGRGNVDIILSGNRGGNVGSVDADRFGVAE